MARGKKKNKVGWIVALIIIVAAGLVVWKVLDDRAKNTFTFNCDGGKSIKATFRGNGSGASADVSLSDGRKMNLKVGASAGGARYSNSSDSVVFWNIGDTARLEENGAETFSNCK